MQSTDNNYDIIIAGAGLAGLSLAYRALQSGVWRRQRILIIDQEPKNRNDRTWSFWQAGAGHFDQLISKSWNKLSVYSNRGEELNLDTADYIYHTIHSLDFYEATVKYLSSNTNVTFLYEEIIAVANRDGHCLVQTNLAAYSSNYVFNSIFKKPDLKIGEQYYLQHFKGLKIKVPNHQFDITRGYLMDFRTTQEEGTSFFYTLPLDAEQLFIEYTIFSKSLLETEKYSAKLSTYIKDVLCLGKYEIVEEEFGVIPMTDHEFQRFEGHTINIGTIGGDTRGATGYTFTNVQETVTKIIAHWESFQTPFFKTEHIGAKQLVYDGTLLNVLNSGKYPGHQLFFDLFKGSRASTVFAFLDSKTSFLKDIMIIKSLRPWPFIKAISGYLYRKVKQY